MELDELRKIKPATLLQERGFRNFWLRRGCTLGRSGLMAGLVRSPTLKKDKGKGNILFLCVLRVMTV